jgi:branched-chain amino acid transport system permease protein
MKTGHSKSDMDFLSRMLDWLCLTPLGAGLLVILAVLPFIPPFNDQYLLRWLTIIAFTAASSIAFDLTAGFINIVNFGFAAILGLGAYNSALLAVRVGLSPWIGIFVGALASGVLGFLTGALTLRLRGIFAAVMAWFIGLALMGLCIKMVWLTRGALGLQVPRMIKTDSNLPYYYMMIIMLLVVYIACRWVTRSKMGLAFKAIGQNMEAARTSGINPTYYRIVNFTISCTIAGWLGGFYAHYMGILTPDLLHTSKTVEVLAVAYIGGRGSLWGGAFIAFPFLVAMELIRSGASNLPGLHLVIYGVFLVLVMIYLPGGVASLYYRFLYKPWGRFWQFMVGYRENK